MSYGTIQIEKMTTESGYSLGAGDSTSFKNKLINGDMRVDQRNAGASVSVPTATSQAFITDRWFVQNLGSNSNTFTCQQSTDAPAGFKNSLLITNGTGVATVSSDSRLLAQYIEGLNIIDLAFGTASAKGIVVSFQVKSSLTGTFSGCILSNAGDQVYGFTFTISSANTWTPVAVSIPGSTTGTWPTDNTTSMRLQLNLGSGSSSLQPTANVWASSGGSRGVQGTVNLSETTGATFRITAAQIEVGTVATSFDFRSYGTELALCQRYYFKVATSASNASLGAGFANDATRARIFVPFAVEMRTDPVAVEQTGTASDYKVAYLTTAATCTAVPSFANAQKNGGAVNFTVASGLTGGNGIMVERNANTAFLAWSTEL